MYVLYDIPNWGETLASIYFAISLFTFYWFFSELGGLIESYEYLEQYVKKEIKTVKSVSGFIEFSDEVTIYKVMPELFKEEDKDNYPRNCQFIAYLTEHKEDFGIKDIYISGYDALTGEGLRFQDAPFEEFDVFLD